ncbi:permease prefix domain 1-containing protein [Bacillus timonensis]|uniref:permease prefix domain 1-containing protein n=1 Tax=Bacillus timonensis TaxID=1033734 RepID=UPI001A951757|nr:permease prefix domain 1-containing protein [Bacillus timonensis]
MKQIDEFVNLIYSDVKGKEAIELKQEMRSHLLEAVSELKAEGKSEKEAIDIAISRFGDEKQITKGLFTLFKTQNNVIKNLFRTSIVALVLGLIVLIGLIWNENNNQNRLHKIDQTINSVFSMLSDGTFSEENNKKIISIVEATKEIEYFVIYKNPEPGKGVPKQEIIKNWEVAVESGDSSIKGSTEYVWMDIKDPYENYYMVAGYHQISTLDNFYSIPIGLFIAFAVLGLTSTFLKIKTNRKMLNAFIK